MLFTHKQSNQGECPTGVSLHKRDNLYRAQLKIDSVAKHLGYFKTVDEAEHVYKSAKTAEIHRQAQVWKSQIDPRVFDALLTYKV